MLHRALFGSIERFFAILVEHFAGALPTWLAPSRSASWASANDHQEYADQVAHDLRGRGIRVEDRPGHRAPGRTDPQGEASEDPYILVVATTTWPPAPSASTGGGVTGPTGASPWPSFTTALLDEVAARSLAERPATPAAA